MAMTEEEIDGLIAELSGPMARSWNAVVIDGEMYHPLMLQAADLIAAQREALEELRDGADLLGQLLGADPGPKYAAAAKAARDWWLAYDAKAFGRGV